MKVTRLFLTFALTLIASVSFAQNIKVTGQVTDASTGEPVAFANLMVVGTTTGTATDIDGNYTINADKNASIIFSMIGYDDITVPVGGKAVVNVQMQPSTTFLQESVVSALGITRAAKSLTYSAETVSSEDLTVNKTTNMIQALAGKAAGITITNSAAGMGGSSKISIRGYRSTRGNSPLIVVNGIPVGTNGGTGGGGILGDSGGSTDTGDALGGVNAEDIESMSILKGASASALYGTEAANGVILITTKKGAKDRVSVTYTNNTLFENVAYHPQFQHEYGESANWQNWGAKLSEPAKVLFENFFKTAPTIQNNLAITGGNEKNQTYLSYGHTYASSILDNNSSLNRHNLTFRNTTKFTDKLSLDISVQFVNQIRRNGAPVNGQYVNPIYSVWNFPIGRDWKEWQENYEIYDPDRNMMVMNWYRPASYDDNPWWDMKKVNKFYRQNKAITSATLRYDINEHVYLQARGGFNYYDNVNESKIAASTAPHLITSNNGRYSISKSSGNSYYADVLGSYNNKWGKFSLIGTIGASVKYTDGSYMNADSSNTSGDLYYPNIFTYNNMTKKGGDAGIDSGSELIGIFATVTLGYNDWLFLDVTGRNDWTSSLAYSTSFKSGFFYPSVGLSGALNEALNMGPAVDLFKLRVSYAKVGNSLPGGVTNPLGYINGSGNAIPNTTAPFGELKPELSASWEAGADLRFFGNRLSLDFTWYKTNSTNQLLTIPSPAGSKWNNYYVNAGNIQNQGFEATLGFTPIETKNFVWRGAFTGSRNVNKILELHPDMNRIMLVNGQNQETYQYLEPGGAYGDMYGSTLVRNEDGSLKLNEKGLPIKSTTIEKIANATPKFRLGWNNTLTFGGFNIGFLVDARFGGEVLSISQANMDCAGRSLKTAEDRNRGYAEYYDRKTKDTYKFNDVEGFYNTIAQGINCVKECYVYDATNIRLREASIGYSFPSAMFKKGIKGIDLSVTGRNLFFFYNAAPYDPDSTISTGDSYEGMDIYNTPITRSFGFNVKLSF